MMEATKEERCLVCNSDGIPLHSLIDPFAHNEDYNKSGSTTNNTLNQQLSVIFLLRKVLRLDKSFLETTLQSTGSNPSLWNVKLCRVCYRTFEEADFVFTRFRKLHLEFIGLSNVLCTKLIHSVKSSTTIYNDDCLAAPACKKRRPGRPKKAKRGVLKESIDMDDPSITVAEKIRKAIFTQKKDAAPMAYDFDDFTLHRANSSNGLTSPSLSPNKVHPKVLKAELNEDQDWTQKVQFKGVRAEDVFEIDQNNSLNNGNQEQHETNNTNTVNAFEIEQEHEASEMGNTAEEDRNSDMDYAPDFDSNDEQYDGNNSDVVEDDSDSDFEPSTSSTRKRTRTTRGRRKTEENSSMGIILKAIKMENARTYACPKCQEVFENVSSCDAHILHKHYGGKWPRNFSCHICDDVSFKGENWLRIHYNMRHPGVKLSMDETLERSIDEGIMPELTYEVIPVGQTMSFPDNHNDDSHQKDGSEDVTLFNRTVNVPPPDAFSIPVVQAGGRIRYLVLPKSIKRIPEVFSLIEVGAKDKSCSSCDRKYPTELQLQAHFKRAHEGEPMSYRCPLCPKGFERIGKVLIHVQRVHIHSKNACNKCGNQFKEEILLKAHIQRVHFGIEYPYKCIKCSIRYPRRSMLNKHLKRVHRLQLASYYLLVKPKQKPGMKRIKRKKRGKLEKKFACETCLENGQMEMKFVSEEELDIHIKRRHMGISRPYPCTICGKKYSKPSKVEQHMKSHTVRSDLHVDDEPSVKEKPLPFVCTPCNKQFENQARYNAHLKGRNHQDLKTFFCELCSQGFTGLKYLKNHQSQKHHEELNIDPFKCKYCNTVLSSERTLNDHIKLIHTKDANFSCPYCDVQFQHKSNMETHINALHTKTQHFLCPQCPKAFLREYYLKNHMMRCHCEEKPYECQFCLKKFSDKPTYNRHVEAHSDVVHSCPHCHKSGFKTRHALRVHRRTFHKELLDEIERKKKLAAYVRPEVPQPSDDDSNSVTGETFNNMSGDTEEGRIEVMNKLETDHLDLSQHHEMGNTSNFQISTCATESVANLFL